MGGLREGRGKLARNRSACVFGNKLVSSLSFRLGRARPLLEGPGRSGATSCKMERESSRSWWFGCRDSASAIDARGLDTSSSFSRPKTSPPLGGISARQTVLPPLARHSPLLIEGPTHVRRLHTTAICAQRRLATRDATSSSSALHRGFVYYCALSVCQHGWKGIRRSGDTSDAGLRITLRPPNKGGVSRGPTNGRLIGCNEQVRNERSSTGST